MKCFIRHYYYPLLTNTLIVLYPLDIASIYNVWYYYFVRVGTYIKTKKPITKPKRNK